MSIPLAGHHIPSLIRYPEVFESLRNLTEVVFSGIDDGVSIATAVSERILNSVPLGRCKMALVLSDTGGNHLQH